MSLEQLKASFYELVAPSLPNEWDVEEALCDLAAGSGEHLEEIFAQVPAIWAVSHSLCFAYLTAAGPALACLAVEELSLWVHTLLDRYETGGLRSAQVFMDDVGQQFALHLRGQGGLRLADIRARLQPYVNGLAGRDLPLLPASQPATDGEAIFLPPEVAFSPDQEENFLLYKLMVSFQWACLTAGTFADPPSAPRSKKAAHPLDCFFAEFAHPGNACALYHVFETSRILSFLDQELPGLMRRVRPLLTRLPLAIDTTNTPNVLEHLQHILVRGHQREGRLDDRVSQAQLWITRCGEEADNNRLSLEAVRDLLLPPVPGEDFSTVAPLLFQGVLRLQEMRNAGAKQQADKAMRLMQAVTVRLPAVPESLNPPEARAQNAPGAQGQDLAVLMETPAARRQVSIPEAARGDNSVINAALADLPSLSEPPEGPSASESVAAAEGQAGQAFQSSARGVSDNGQWQVSPVAYDEWDYRRKGFRKNWCVVREKEITPVRTAFVEQTLRQYRGAIRRLRHQFELMQTSERFVRRQREGNDIDLDALVQSLGDVQAGRPPSDRLFIRLAREDRDIAVYFLVDMSNSTAGWVGQSIKEALVLICEAMEVLNDRYGIYGFSGMRRLRCEVFPVKTMEERYTNEVRQRISAIGPREYTRMAPAIRHMTSLFSKVEARVRLLIMLSDGKPEDYDHYKGEYAIEDTRHALLEAKARGIHPFCITIDRQAHEYMAHMYGEVNYIFIDQVHKLPARMSEIYRTLTS